MRDKISVIIPVYNVERYLERCLKSVAENTYRNLEIICVNDGSTDGSGAILDRFAQQDERFVVIHKENGGASSARNRGLDAATGAFIAFIDSDDWVHPQCFEIMMHFQKTHDYDLVFCEYARVSKMEPMKPYSMTDVKTSAMDLAGIYGTYYKSVVCGRIFRKEMMKGKHFDESIKTAEDSAFLGLVLGNWRDLRICCVHEALYFYYNRPGSLVYQHGVPSEIAFVKTVQKYAADFEDNNSKHVILLDAFKRCLSERYEISFEPDGKKYVKECEIILKGLTRDLLRLPNVSAKDKAKYAVLGTQPALYRMYLLTKNPDLRQWEKEQKKLHAKKESGH